MTADALAVVQCIFSTVWRLYTSWYIPGTHVTPAGFLMFMVAACLSLKLLSRLFLVASDTDVSSDKSSRKSRGD